METVGANGVWTRETAVGEKRDLWSAMKRGFRSRCPRCGKGKLFRAFLKVDDHCSACGLDFTPHAFRHLAAYKILEHDPTAYPLVQRVLGHKSLETTVRFYCGLEVPQALAHFQALVLASSQRGAAAPPRRPGHL